MTLTIQSANRHGFEEIYRDHIGIVQFTLRCFRFPIQVQEELIQEVFLRYFEQVNARDAIQPKSFLVTVARNMAIDTYRKQKRRSMDRHVPVEDLQHELAAVGSVRNLQQLHAVEEFLQQVKDDPQASTLVQYYDEDLSIKEIAARSNESMATVSSRLSRQRKKYRAVLEGKLDQETYAYG